jgi:hypothetical protein
VGYFEGIIPIIAVANQAKPVRAGRVSEQLHSHKPGRRDRRAARGIPGRPP